MLLGKKLTEILTLLEKKELKSSDVFDYFTKRIKKYNKELNAYLTTVDYKENKGKLNGIPIAVKDNFCTKDVRTTASSKVLDNFVPPYSATVVEKLLNAGGTILGKTNMDAWAHGSSTETSDYGPTKNPWDKTRAAGGSSGGSAAAVSSYLAPVALGTETAGSIRQPAAWCGVIGLKPTYGRVSRYGVVAMGSSFDCPGPVSLSTKDAALILEVIAGKDSYDATTGNQSIEKYSEKLDDKKKYTIGYTDEYLKDVDKDVVKNFEEALKTLEKLGHKIKKIELISPKYSISVYTILQRAEVSSNLARYDGIRYGNERTYFGQEAKRRMMLGTYALSYGYYDAYYKLAQKVRTKIKDDFTKAFKEVQLIFAPTTPVTALKLGEWEKYPFFGEIMDVLNEPAAAAGIPAINFPAGFDKNNLPIGMQVIGNQFKEQDVLNISYQFEKETNFFDVIQKGVKNYPD